MYIEVDIVFSKISAEGPDQMWLDQLTTFQDPTDPHATPIKFINEDGYLYTGLLIHLLPEIEKRFGKTNVMEILTEELDIKELLKVDPNYLRGITLREYQRKIIGKSIFRNRGTIELATGAGKTEIAIAIMKWLIMNGHVNCVTILVGTQFLMDQFYSRIMKRLGEVHREGITLRDEHQIIDLTIGRLGDKYRELDSDIVVGVVDSFYNGIKGRDKDVLNILNRSDLMIVDESHHLTARTWQVVARQMENARFRFGLTPAAAEDPWEPDPKDYEVIGLTGPVVASMPASYLCERGYLAKQFISMLHVYSSEVRGSDWGTIYRRGIVKHRNRNIMALTCAVEMYNLNNKVLMFVSQLEHGWRLLKSLHDMGYPAYFARGGNKLDHIDENGKWVTEEVGIEELASRLNALDKFILVGSVVFDEGADLPYINCLIMTAGFKKYRRTLQRLGRGMRAKPGDNNVYTFDFFDFHNNSLARHSRNRSKTYYHEGHTVYANLDSIREHFNAPFDTQVSIPWGANYKGGPINPAKDKKKKRKSR